MEKWIVGGVIVIAVMLLLLRSWAHSENFASVEEKQSAISQFFEKCGNACKFTDYRAQISPDVVEYSDNTKLYRCGKLQS